MVNPFLCSRRERWTHQDDRKSMDMSLDENIPKLIAGESIDPIKEPQDFTPKDSTYTYEACRDYYKEFVSNHKDTYDSFEIKSGIISFSYKINEEPIKVTKSFMLSSILHFPKHSEAVSALKKDLEEKFGSKTSLIYRITEKKIFELEYETECSKCKKKLGKCDQYLCTNCKPGVYFCKNCVAPNSDVAKIEDLVHPHGLYFIREGSDEEMKKVFIGAMDYNKITTFERVHHNFHCNLYNNEVRGAHFCCANCYNFDICEECFKILENSLHEKYAEKLEIVTKNGHNLKTDVLIREEFGDMLIFLDDQ